MTIDQRELRRYLSDIASSAGLELDEFERMGRAGELTDPEARDAWLIWGDMITNLIPA